MRLHSFLILAGAAAAALAACNSTTSSDCSFAPPIIFSQSEVMMQVRDTLTIAAQFGPACSGAPGNRAGVFHWKSANPAVVAVDSVKGTLRGVSPGVTFVTATDTLDTSLSSNLPVQVTARQNGG